MTEKKWVQKARYWIAPKPSKPGVWRVKEGGFLVRARVTDPRTGKKKELLRFLDVADAGAAYRWLQEEIERMRSGPPPEEKTRTLPSWGDYAVSLLERKVTEGQIKSAHTREVWGSTLKRHLIPAFGKFQVDEIRRTDVIAWKTSVGEKIAAGTYSPHTANDWLTILSVITNAAFDEFEIDRRSPTAGIAKFDTSAHPSYTDEEPNSLTADEAKAFLAAMRRLYPQHFAMVALGFATGLRPSSLRPLRREGKTPDVLWEEGVLLVRRSHTRKKEVMDKTKTGRRQRLTLPKDLVDILRWHVDSLPDEGPMKESELLFPSETGSFRAPSVLDKPFRAVAKEIGLRKRLTPRGMRRTFQDLARAAEVRDVVTRAVSGHATETMQRHYSTVNADEMRDGLARVVSLAGFREALKAREGEAEGGEAGSGVKSGVKSPKTSAAG